MKTHDHPAHDVNVKKIDRLSSTRVRLTCEFPDATVKAHENMTANRYLQVAKIPGFRPGKAPLQMIRERFKEDIKKDVISHLLEAGLAEAIEKTKLMPVNRPKIELPKIVTSENAPFEFHAEFEVQPEIELRKYKGAPLKDTPVEASEEEVTKTLNHLRDRFSVLEPSEATKPEKGSFDDILFSDDLSKVCISSIFFPTTSGS